MPFPWNHIPMASQTAITIKARCAAICAARSVKSVIASPFLRSWGRYVPVLPLTPAALETQSLRRLLWWLSRHQSHQRHSADTQRKSRHPSSLTSRNSGGGASPTRPTSQTNDIFHREQCRCTNESCGYRTGTDRGQRWFDRPRVSITHDCRSSRNHWWECVLFPYVFVVHRATKVSPPLRNNTPGADDTTQIQDAK